MPAKSQNGPSGPPWRALLVCLVSWSIVFALGAPGQAEAQELAVEKASSIGVLTGDPAREFGHIIGMDVDDERGLVYLIDRLNHRLSVFGRDGRFIAATGRHGDGPGEFRYPRAVAASDSLVYVFDPGIPRLTSYELRDTTLVRIADYRLAFQGWDMCFLDGGLYVLRYHRGGLIQRLDLEGRVVASFGRPFRDGDETVARLTDMGHVLCDESTRSVFVAPYSKNLLRRYTASGELVWEKQVPGMVIPNVSRTRGGVRYESPSEGESTDMLVYVAAVPDGRLLVQYGESFRGMSNPEDILEVQSVVVGRNDGAVIGIHADLPRIDFAVGSHAYSRANDPYPRVTVFEWR